MKLNFIRRYSKSIFVACLFAATGLLGHQKASAQYPASSYGFSALTGTYADLVGGSFVEPNPNWVSYLDDDVLSTPINIGFPFIYCGTTYSSLVACTNGFISFDTNVTSNTWNNETWALPDVVPGLFPLWDDLAGWGNGAESNYKTTGTAPNRIFTIEYKNWSWRLGQGDDPQISFQVKLYEGTNVIDYIYRQEPTPGNPGGATIGIGDNLATSTFLTLDGSGPAPAASSATWTNSIVDEPATNQIYRFTPPPPCNTVSSTLPTAGTVAATPATICLSGNVTIDETPNIAMPPVTGITYKWQTSPTATGTYTDIPGAITTLPTYTTTTPITASAYFRCVAICSGTTNLYTTPASNQVVVNNPGDPTGVPGSRCGPGAVALSATAPSINPTADLNWYADNTGGASVGNGATYTTPYITANTTFYVSATVNGCEGNKVPVLATVNVSTPVAHVAPTVVCNNAVATITVTPPTPAYPSYNWSADDADLYTDAAGTIAYTGGSATTIYLKTTNVASQNIYLLAGDTASTTGCTYADTIKVWVQPGNVVIKGNPDTICVAGSSTLKLNPIDGYYANTIQWQMSLDGSNYTNINGATTSTYITPSLNFGQNRYFRAEITAAGAVCQEPTKYVVISNPTLLGADDSFNCGPGTVTLNATTGGNSTPVWYATPTGGYSIASGNPYVTPYLGTTTSFWVASRGGGVEGTVASNPGTESSFIWTDNMSPFSGQFGGSKNQYLILASELSALGIPAGANINSLALDVTSTSGTTYQGFSISMKLTTNTSVTSTYETGTQPVFGPDDVNPAMGVNTYPFTSPFQWDGTSNVLIQVCWGNNNFFVDETAVAMDPTTFDASNIGQSNQLTASDMCAATTTDFDEIYQLRPKFILSYDNRCETPRQEVIAYIRPLPVVDLGADLNVCVDSAQSYILDAGVQPNDGQYLWNDLSTSQILPVFTSNTYSVTVTNEWGCATTDAINVHIRHNPIISLGNDTSICNGATLTLDPGNTGIQYFWSTGQPTHTITVNQAGPYIVYVTNADGCTSSDTIVVSTQGQLPQIDGIQVSNNGHYSFNFTAANPQNVVGYDWDFGDGTAHSFLEAPTHTYADGGNYIVILRLSSTCGFVVDTLGAHIVGIHQINVSNDALNVYPNPTAGSATIAVNGDLKMEKVEVYNVLGQVVYTKKTDSPTKHNLDLGALASGIYTIQVYTDKGTVARKLDVSK
jgi:hypothetical protein